MCTGVLELGVASMCRMSLASRFNGNSYFVFVIAAHVMFCPNFSVTNELLTKLHGQICALEYLSRG